MPDQQPHEPSHLGAAEALRLIALPPQERELLAHALGCARCQARIRRALEEPLERPLRKQRFTPERLAISDQVEAGLAEADELLDVTGFTGPHEGFRRAVAGLRLAERRTDAVLAAAFRATNLLLSPFFPEFRQLDEEAGQETAEPPRPSIGRTRTAGEEKEN